MLGDGPRRPRGVLQGGGAEVHPRASRRERATQRGVVANTAGHLHLHVEARDHVGEEFGVRSATEGGIEIDEVDPLRSPGLPLERGGNGIAVGRLRASLALEQAHRLAVRDVNGGQ